jgi:Ca2+-binding EF-hand superfamily protein
MHLINQNIFTLLYYYLYIASGRLNFDGFSNIAGHFLEEDDEAMQEELKEAFRLYDREG